MFDYVRVTCAVPAVGVADVAGNCEKICAMLRRAKEQGSGLVVFPELCLTGATCQDLWFQEVLISDCLTELDKIRTVTEELSLTAVVGVPLKLRGRLYNCAVVICGGQIKGVVPKTYLSAADGEQRWFSAGEELAAAGVSLLQGYELGAFEEVPVGQNLLFRLTDGTVFGVEVGSDLFAPVPPSTLLALAGAEFVVNTAACTEQVESRAYRRHTVMQQSARCRCGYVLCSAGVTESTTDHVYSGHSVVAENGKILGENHDILADDYLLTVDMDMGLLRSERMKDGGLSRSARMLGVEEGLLQTLCLSAESDGSLYPVSKLPFIPEERGVRRQRCLDIFRMQAAGLKKRMAVTGGKTVIGISGGLDSTLALLVAVEAARQLGRPLTDVVGITMPCFGTTDRTKNNALELMETLGITSLTVPIAAAVEQHFADIGHDKSVTDLTFENAQARERTQVLMDYAGKVGGFVVGTGDLSELALGWCTYNGDHMSMYGVNGSVPKTLLRWMIDALVEADLFPASNGVLRDVLDTPISPELLPPDADGTIAQQTESIVGPYALHDFFLYYVLRHGFTPEKIYHLACRAFCEDFDGETVKKWLVTFYRRFMTQQFKRTCMPDGIKIGAVGLSPRGDLRMPSDAVSRLWLQRAEAL